MAVRSERKPTADGVFRADRSAYAAFHTLRGIDSRLLQNFASDGVCRANLCAFGATNAGIGDFELGQLWTLPRRTCAAQMRLKLRTEFMQRAEDHVRRSPSKRAEGTLLNLSSQHFNPVKDVRRFRVALS